MEKEKDLLLRRAVFERFSDAFPEMEAKRTSSGWKSSFDLDGKRHQRADKTYWAKPDFPYICENGSADRKADIYTLYASLNGYELPRQFGEVVKALFSAVGMEEPSPEYTDEQRRAYAVRKEREEAFLRSVEALNSNAPEAIAAREFLDGRNFGPEKRQVSPLGLATPDFLESVGGDTRNTWRVVIPFVSEGETKGYIFRSVDGKEPKYTNTQGVGANSGLFAFDPYEKRPVIVEGPLDALHAKATGVRGVCACLGGGGLTSSQVERLKECGIKEFTLMYDNDEAGEGFTRKTFERLQGSGISAYVGTLPREFNGKPIKDVDDYFSAGGTAEAFSEIVRKAPSIYTYQAQRLADTYESGEKTDKDFSSFTEGLISLAAKATTPAERRGVDEMLQRYTGETLSSAIDEAKRKEEERLECERIKASVAEVSTASTPDEARQALARAKKRADLNAVSSRLSERLVPYGRAQYLEDAQRSERYIRTSFEFSTSYEDLYFEDEGTLSKEARENLKKARDMEGIYPLQFPTGYVGVIAAPTNHRKSTFLRNLCLDVVLHKENDGARALYLTAEEAPFRVYQQLFDTYAHTDEIGLLPTPKGKMRAEWLRDYFTGEWKEDGDLRRNLDLKRSEFEEMTEEGGSISLHGISGLKVDEILSLIRIEHKENPFSVVFIDYLQFLADPGSTRGTTAEVTDIMRKLNALAQELNIAIVTASQMNRQAGSPGSLSMGALADAAEVYRGAEVVVLLWYTSKRPMWDTKKEEDFANIPYTWKRLAGAESFQNPETHDYLLAYYAKGRGVPDAFSILSVDAPSGRIYPNECPSHPSRMKTPVIKEDKPEKGKPTKEKKQKEAEPQSTPSVDLADDMPF